MEVWAIATHGVLSDPAIERIAKCDSLKGVVITNTIPHDQARVAKV